MMRRLCVVVLSNSYLSNNQLEDKDLEQGCLVNTTLSTL